jgi:hypothetical protein
LLLLAVRAARRAIQANPRDALAYLLLGEAYLRLAGSTRERGWGPHFRQLAQVRRNQTVAAFQQALRLNPDLARAHAALALVYAEAGYADLTLEHLRGQLRAERRTAGESAADFEVRQANLRRQVDATQKEVERLLASFEVNAAELKTSDRAAYALRRGLPRKGLDILLQSDTADFGPPGLRLELLLLLICGRVDDIRAWLEPEHRLAVGDANYDWLQAQAAAAVGDYAGADENLAAMAASIRPVQVGRTFVLPARPGMALAATQSVLEHRIPEGGPALLAATILNRLLFLGRLGRLVSSVRQESDLLVLRGQLALEAGNVEQAERCWRRALEAWGSAAAVAAGSGVDFGARPVARYGLDRLAAHPRR